MDGHSQENVFWEKVNKVMGEYGGERVPKCVQFILRCCGYNRTLSLENFCNKNLSDIEECIRKFFSIAIKNFDCTSHGCPIAHYKHQNVFKILPGHRTMITSLAEYINRYHQKKLQENCHSFLRKNIETHSGFSKIMKEMIQAAVESDQGSKNKSQYTDVMKYFGTYVFNMAGRACYNFLCKNLPLPSASSVCE